MSHVAATSKKKEACHHLVAQPAGPVLAWPAAEPGCDGGLLLYVLDQRLLGAMAGPASERTALPGGYSHDTRRDCGDADWQSLCPAYGVHVDLAQALGHESPGVGRDYHRTGAHCF